LRIVFLGLQGAEAMQLSIKMLNGEKRTFEFEPNDTVSSLKDRLADQTGIASEMIRLLFRGRALFGAVRG
jgi:hypothetical protein